MAQFENSKNAEQALTILIKGAKGIQGEHSVKVMVAQCGSGYGGEYRVKALLDYTGKGFGKIDTRTVESRSVEVYDLLKALCDTGKLPLPGNVEVSFTQKRLRELEGLEALVTSGQKLSGEQLMQFMREKAPASTAQQSSPPSPMWWAQL